MSNNGSLGYQMMAALKLIFRPGHSRYEDQKHQREDEVIRGIGTMRSMSADVHQFARYIRSIWPEVKDLRQVTPEMAQMYIAELVKRERSGGRIGRVCASIRKLDTACRSSGIFPEEAPALLPYKSEGGPGGFHSEPRQVAYSVSQAHQIILHVSNHYPAAARVLMLMLAAGLRITEACYLRAQDIHLEDRLITLDLGNNANRTKGGRPREVSYLPEEDELMGVLHKLGTANPTGHIFKNRGSLPDQTRTQVRQACQELRIPCLGTHGFRKTFARNNFEHELQVGASRQEAIRQTSFQLGHNRSDVTRQSYLPSDSNTRNETK